MKYLTSLVLLLCALPLAAQTLEYRVLIGGDDIGHMIVDTAGEQLSIDFDFKQNGRGPTIAETMTLDQRGYPIERNITGRTTFGSKVDESFRIEGNSALWQDATGTGVARVDKDPHFYVDQDGSVYGAALLTRALLAAADGRVTVYPAGQATIRTRSDLSFSGPAGDLNVTAYELLGLSLNPALILLDQDREFFATASGRFSIVRKGYESADQALRDLAVQLSTERFAEIQKKVAQTFDSPVRIRNVRVFEPSTLGLTSPKDVVIYGNRITSVQPARSPASASEVIVDGAGGTLVAGMYEMHGHLGQENALLNIAAGVTSVRDMGNENDVLDGLIGRINRGEIAGPRITRSCFIEGKSEFSAQTGELVDSLQAGLDMVRWCASRDFHQVKFYNSMKPEWADALVEEAHRLGLRVAGHVPAFARADDMIAAGFDEITHANQLLLGWVLNDGEDTRTLFRFTAMKRFPAISRDGEDVQFTLGQMVERNVAHDPTIAIHEHGLTAVNGEVAPLARDIIDHLPTNEQRSYKKALFGTDTDEERAEYVAAFDVVLDMLSFMHEEGILLLPGTDLGGSFAYHRELELFEKIGLSPAEVLRRASYDMAVYLDQDEDLGSIKKGKYADFFLVPGDPTQDLSQLRKIQMVASDGVLYFPDQIYPQFGIKPFAAAPTLIRSTASQVSD